jgi:hypothetical protein
MTKRDKDQLAEAKIEVQEIDKRYNMASFEQSALTYTFNETYDEIDEQMGANLARVIGNQQIKKFYPKIPLETYEKNEDWHIGYARGKQIMLEAFRHWISNTFDRPQEEIDSVLNMRFERPLIEIHLEDELGNFRFISKADIG